jgi:WD40 repeat protein
VRSRRLLALLRAVLALTIRLPVRNAAISSQDMEPSEQLHGVLSRTRLSPPLRAPATHVRFSPDGDFIFVQFESGIFVLKREPLSVQTWIHAPGILTPRFAKASQTLILATQDLEISSWNLASNTLIERHVINPGNECMISNLSLDGSLAACLDAQLVLRVYETKTGKQILAKSASSLIPDFSAALIRRSMGTAYAHMIGYAVAEPKRALGYQDLFGWQLEFSPEGHYVFVSSRFHTMIAFDLASEKSISVSSTIDKHTDATIRFISEDKLFISEPDQSGEGRVVEFPRGRAVQNLPATASAEPATQKEYLLLTNISRSRGREVQVLESNSGKMVRTVSDASLDIWNGMLAKYRDDGTMELIQLSSNQVMTREILPAPGLPELRAACVSPDLTEIAVAVRGAAGVFPTDKGTRLQTLDRMSGGWFASDAELYLEAPGDNGEVVSRGVNLEDGTSAELWRAKLEIRPAPTIMDAHSSGPVILFHSQPNVGRPLDDRAMIYTLPLRVDERKLWARDVQSGKELWTRTWISGGGQVTPYADPQDDRVLVGWRVLTISNFVQVLSRGVEALARRYPELRKQLTSTQLTLDDAVFEVLDVRTAEPLGTVFVRVGGGPESFDAAFSVGDSVIFQRPDGRITVYSLSTGKITARAYGRYVSASGSSNLLAAVDGNRLRLFDLKGGSKRDEYLFPDAPLYTRFSTDGKRLLALTEQQFVYILDVPSPEATTTLGHNNPKTNIEPLARHDVRCAKGPSLLAISLIYLGICGQAKNADTPFATVNPEGQASVCLKSSYPSACGSRANSTLIKPPKPFSGFARSILPVRLVGPLWN